MSTSKEPTDEELFKRMTERVHQKPRTELAKAVTKRFYSGAGEGIPLGQIIDEEIARHHAEERAAVEKAEKALESCLRPMRDGVEYCKSRALTHGAFDRAIAAAEGALTALRTASQSPTK